MRFAALLAIVGPALSAWGAGFSPRGASAPQSGAQSGSEAKASRGLKPALQPDWNRTEKEALEFLQRYMQVQSVNPPANTEAAAKLVQAMLEGHGIAVKLYRSGPAGQTNLPARLPGRDRSRKPLLLLNHMDVVPVDRGAWKLDPFAGILRAGQIWGRGSLDMKGLGTQQMFALVALKQAGIPSTCSMKGALARGTSWPRKNWCSAWR